MSQPGKVPAFISDTRPLAFTKPSLPRLEVSYMGPDGPGKQSFDMSTHEGRKFHSRFVIWAIQNDVTYTGNPAK